MEFGSTPTFADIDKDGDLDAFIGDSDGDTKFFQNTGSLNSPKFATPQANPFGLSNEGRYSAPTFADIDGDGDLDAFIGQFFNTLFFQNTGSASSPKFAAPQVNPFGLSRVGYHSKPTFTDVDGDRDLDAFIGAANGNINFFQNTGSLNIPKFAAPQANPFGLSDVGEYSAPTFTDIDGDGNLDAFIGSQDGNINFFSTDISPKFADPVTNPFGLRRVGQFSAPTFADIDGDGDLDAFTGEYFGDTFYFQNTGSANSPSFATPVANPFDLGDVGLESTPTFTDIDGDRDLDAFIGNQDGNTFYFQNTGSLSSPNFAAPQANAFGLSNVGLESTLTFADIDGDRDLDAFTGEFNGNTFFFQNTGSPSSPKFAAPVANPFGLRRVGYHSIPTFTDIDGDRDLDAFIGSQDGTTNFFRNIGSATSTQRHK